jgi:hypothetical protein
MRQNQEPDSAGYQRVTRTDLRDTRTRNLISGCVVRICASARVTRARLVIEVQGKASALLGLVGTENAEKRDQ